jgi:hypothetical protein
MSKSLHDIQVERQERLQVARWHGHADGSKRTVAVVEAGGFRHGPQEAEMWLGDALLNRATWM